MRSLWFVMPVHGRIPLAAICLRQLRRTCDELIQDGIDATAVVVGDQETLDELEVAELGFATVERNNEFVSRKFNDGIDLACDPSQTATRPERQTASRYRVIGNSYRGHERGTIFEALLDRGAQRRAIVRGDVELVEHVTPRITGAYTLPSEWDPGRPADYVVPIGSDDWVDWRLFLDLPRPDTFVGFRRISFVREDGRELTCRYLGYEGGCGMRIYPRQVMETVGFRPADEDRARGCDTSILVNLRRKLGNGLRVHHADSDARQIVDWKTPGDQLNPYESLVIHRGQVMGDPFAELAAFFPADGLAEMREHYSLPPRWADRSRSTEAPAGASLVEGRR